MKVSAISGVEGGVRQGCSHHLLDDGGGGVDGVSRLAYYCVESRRTKHDNIRSI